MIWFGKVACSKTCVSRIKGVVVCFLNIFLDDVQNGMLKILVVHCLLLNLNSTCACQEAASLTMKKGLLTKLWAVPGLMSISYGVSQMKEHV